MIGKLFEQISNHVLNKAKSGDIILCHDIPGTIEAIPALIDGLKVKGFELNSTAYVRFTDDSLIGAFEGAQSWTRNVVHICDT